MERSYAIAALFALGASALAGCSPPVKVHAIASTERQRGIVQMTGTAMGFVGDVGVMNVKSADGSLSCKGNFKYHGGFTAKRSGSGQMTCNTGETAEVKFKQYNALSGYGEGVTDRGRIVAFTFGLSDKTANQRLAESPAGQKIGFRPDGSIRRYAGTGSGFFVNGDGYLITNDHVAFRCDKLETVDSTGARRPATLIATQEEPDLAVLKSPAAAPAWISLRRDPEIQLAEDVMIFGFPGVGEIDLSASGVLTRGSLAALSGINNNADYFGFEALAMTGNSGGPVVSADGALVGVVAHGIKDVGGLTFGVKPSRVATFLEAQGVSYRTQNFGRRQEPVARAATLRKATVQVFCNSEE
ncbi:MAG: trypsin-like peptidase domain-containing protein [Pseudomonadota bacterium]